MTKKTQLLTDVSELEKEVQKKWSRDRKEKTTEVEKAKEIRKKALENLTSRKEENAVGM